MIYGMPPVTEAPFVIGYDGEISHAVAWGEAADAVKGRSGEERLAVRGRCGRAAMLVTGWGAFKRGNPHVDRHICHLCAWNVAIEGGRVEDELLAMRPVGYELDRLTELVHEPLMAVKVCEAILARVDLEDAEDSIHRENAAMLVAHASAHAPALIVPEECNEGTCEHEPASRWDDPKWVCPYSASAVCLACTAFAGPYAGEYEGQSAPECTVLAPCSVLVAYASHFDLAIGGQRRQGA